jgi:hypothetical protein
MRFSSVAILVLVIGTAAAQHRGGGTSSGGMHFGPPSLSNGNPFTRSNGSFRPGFGSGLPWQRSQSRPRWGSNSFFFAVPPPIVPYPGYPPDSPYYLQPPPDEGLALPQTDVNQVPTTMSPSLTYQDTHLQPVGSELATQPSARSTAGSSVLHMYQAPGPPPSDSDDHPALVALKNGWAYSILKYWVQGKSFHFITSRGDDMQVPVTQVERIYPSSRQSHLTDPQSPPSK